MKRLLFVLPLVLCGCFSDTSSGSATNGGSGDTGSCAEGSVGCTCYGNESCDAGLRCEPSVPVCVRDSCDAEGAGTAGCLCENGECAAGLQCIGSVCTDGGPTTTTGTSTNTTLPTTATSNGSTATSSGPTTSQESGSGSSSATTTETGAPPVLGPVTIYFTRGDSGGRDELTFGPSDLVFSAREEVDQLCRASMSDLESADIFCDTAVALIATAKNVGVLGLGIPTDRPVQSNGAPGVILNADYPEFVATGGGGDTLDEALVLPSNLAGPAPASFWTGTIAEGDVGETCNSWMSTSEDTGSQGQSAFTNWTNGIEVDCQVGPTQLLCACWDEDP